MAIVYLKMRSRVSWQSCWSIGLKWFVSEICVRISAWLTEILFFSLNLFLERTFLNTYEQQLKVRWKTLKSEPAVISLQEYLSLRLVLFIIVLLPGDEPKQPLCNPQPGKLHQDDLGKDHHIRPRKFKTFILSYWISNARSKSYSYFEMLGWW